MHDSSKTERQPTLLLIDDDLVSREVMATVLSMSGFTVQTAATGEAALELLSGGKYLPDAILMDAQMPGLSGAALIAALRAHTKARILAISASQPPQEILSAADGFLLKPLAAEGLRKALEEQRKQEAPTAAPAVASSLGPNEPVVNPETLAQLRQMMPETAVRQIFAAVVADLGRRMTALEAALAQGDEAEIRRIGHAIKGGCALAGAQQAARLGALIEIGALGKDSNQLDNSARFLRDLRAAALSLERMLEAEFPV
jgi:CheY-like chemotaxis protein/HPt (histidine-containing phosphotransfer) domain-containing protein